MSFNSYKDIDSRLKKIGLSLGAYKRQAEIDALIQRRHKVVHEVDLMQDESSGKSRTRPIKSAQVRIWMECSMDLVQTIDEQVSAWEKQETQPLKKAPSASMKPFALEKSRMGYSRVSSISCC